MTERDLDITGRPDRPAHDLVFGGLDLSNLDAVSSAEVEAFTAFYVRRFGHPHAGLSYLLQQRPDALKRFRLYVRVGYSQPGAAEQLFNLGFLAYYALLGYETGTRYVIQAHQNRGFGREHCLDAIAMVALVVGPRGLETIAQSLRNYVWQEPHEGPAVPAEWVVDLDAFQSGLEFANHKMQTHELALLTNWYMKWLGEVPPSVTFLERHHPDALKSYRNRFEHCLRVLPRQAMPLTLLHFYVMCGSGAGIRENLLLARGFGVTKEQAVRVIVAGMEYGGLANVELVASVAGDLLENWQ